ncbi:MAG: YlxR family protein [Micrococcales bacterium]|nr:YlxR family protein [Micrococcales bacterium]
MPDRRPPQDIVVSEVPAGPVRTCVGCRERGSRSSLLRVVLVTDNAGSPATALDEAARLPGRGAWLHPDLDCLALAQRRKAFGRALRHAGPLDTHALDEAVAQVVAARAPSAGPHTTRKRVDEADGCPMSTHR